jgi:hypothetical protein
MRFHYGEFEGYDIYRLYKSGDGLVDGRLLTIEFLAEINFLDSFENELIQK